jgi:hypothetical protein
MDDVVSELDRLQKAYKAVVEQWIAAIKQEEALASVNHTVAEVDKWEQGKSTSGSRPISRKTTSAIR